MNITETNAPAASDNPMASTDKNKTATMIHSGSIYANTMAACLFSCFDFIFTMSPGAAFTPSGNKASMNFSFLSDALHIEAARQPAQADNCSMRTTAQFPLTETTTPE